MIRPGIRRLLRRYGWGESPVRQVDEEVRLHLELRAEQLVSEGMDPEQARQEAKRLFEGSEEERRALYRAARRRDSRVRRRSWLGEGFGDLRHAVRSLGRAPRFTFFVGLTLALGIGANAAMFGIVDRMILSGPAHLVDSDSLIRLYLSVPREGTENQVLPWIPVTINDHIAQNAQTIEAIAPYRYGELVTGTADVLRPRRVSSVGSGYFSTLGVQPSLGRFPDDYGHPREMASVAVISHAIWTQDYGSDPNILGQSVHVDGDPYEIVAVAPEGFTGPELAPVDLWVPFETTPGVYRNYFLVARVREGTSIEAVDRDLRPLAAQIADQLPGPLSWAGAGTLTARPIAYDDAGNEPGEAKVSRLLMAVAVLVLLIACANVVNLLLARVTRRRGEMSVRLALGAGRRRLTRLHVSESLALAALGGLLSLPVAYFTSILVQRVLLPDVEWGGAILNMRVYLLTIGVVLVTGLVVGLIPGREAGKTGVGRGLQSVREKGMTRGSARVHLLLTVLQTGLSAALLIGAGLFVKSLSTIRSTEIGFDAEQVLSVSLKPDPSGEAIPLGSDDEMAVYDRSMEILRGLPGIDGVSLAIGLPLVSTFGRSIHVPGLDSIPALPGGGPYIAGVGEGYFETTGTQILRGRGFTREDRVPGAERVSVISQSMAELLWQDQDPIGRCLHVGTAEDPCSRIVGIVENVHRVGYSEPPSMQYYVPLGNESGFLGSAMAVRFSGPELRRTEEIRVALAGVDPRIGYVEIRSLQGLLDPELRPWRLGASILLLSAILALTVALIGVYGVLSYLVAQRKREVGVRVALGATRQEIRSLFVRTGTMQTALGIALGVAVVWATSRWVQPLLYETEAIDPTIIGGVALLLLAASALACLIPANQASRVDPASSLRIE